MKFTFLKITAVILFCVTFNLAQAADINALNALFTDTFYGSFYRPLQCGQNAENLLRLAITKGIKLDNTYVIKLENKGYSNFGLVGAQKARGRGH
ncbi:MAG: hypothetical protein RJB66_297 [Pseudomonadota bacterium]